MYCTEKPPESIIINGRNYPIKWDFLPWALYFEDFINNFSDDEVENIKIISKMQEIYLGGIIQEDFISIIQALLDFYVGYPKPPMNDKGISNNNEKNYSFKYDLNEIIIAIRNQSGIDLTHRRKGLFHWWDFMLEFQTLTEEHAISKKISYRAYRGNDKEYIKLREIYALPIELTKTDQKMIQEINDLFYNS